MTLLWHLLRSLLCPGLLSALLLGLVCRGLAVWVGAHLGRRPAAPPWQPFLELAHLACKSPPRADASSPPCAVPAATSAVWAALPAVAALAWATGMLPWPRWLPGQELPAALVVYLLLLAMPAAARLMAAGLSADLQAALGLRRLAALELARLLPLLLAGLAPALFSGQYTLAPTTTPTLPGAALATVAAGIVLAALPWPLWDRDTPDGPLAGLGGRTLALFRALEALELAAHIGLVSVILQSGGVFSAGLDGWPLLAAAAAVTVALSAWEWSGRQVLVPEAARAYTRLLLPAAVLLALLGWWLGR